MAERESFVSGDSSSNQNQGKIYVKNWLLLVKIITSKFEPPIDFTLWFKVDQLLPEGYLILKRIKS